jgi:hypothetical protein
MTAVLRQVAALMSQLIIIQSGSAVRWPAREHPPTETTGSATALFADEERFISSGALAHRGGEERVGHWCESSVERRRDTWQDILEDFGGVDRSRSLYRRNRPGATHTAARLV